MTLARTPFVWLCVAAGCGGRGAEPSEAPVPPAGPSEVRMEPAEPASPHAAMAWIALGGGSGPEDNQVQIEADLALVTERLGAGGVMLYAGGPGTRAVQVEDDEAALRHVRADPIAMRLGELLDPRAGRAARYRETSLHVDASATLTNLEAALGRVPKTQSFLTIAIVGHGAQGALPADNELVLWGGEGVRPAELAELIERARAGSASATRFVVTGCYGGAFADLVFAAGDPAHDAAEPIRCGFFATSAEHVASGCDSDPDRRRSEGYLVHVLPALAGKDRDGQPLAPDDIDFDHDGHIVWSEAHARAVIASRGFDVPTTTSERWLEAKVGDVAELPESGDEVSWPEVEAVVRAWWKRLGGDDKVAIDQRLAALEAARASAVEAEQTARDAEDAKARDAIAELLARWPTLGDPWHPEFRADYEAARGDLETWLRENDKFQAYIDARDEADRLAGRADDAALAAVPFERLTRAAKALARAQVITTRGGPELATFKAILACERQP